MTAAGQKTYYIRDIQRIDLGSVNRIVEACVMGWKLPERVKRLSLSSYRYNEQDLDHLSTVVATLPSGTITGIAAWEPAPANELPNNCHGMLLHGLYVAPTHQGQGVGRQLIEYALEETVKMGMDGLLVKSQSDANSYFQSLNFSKLPVENEARDYPHRWWLAINNKQRLLNG
jgi:GNAT superfamily N-acetyltransferase